MQLPVTNRLSLNSKFDKTERERAPQHQRHRARSRLPGSPTTGCSAPVCAATPARTPRRWCRSPRSRVIAPTPRCVRPTTPGGRWLAYGHVQDTVSTDGNRRENNRVGSGGAYRVTDRFKVNGEVSGGDLGSAGRIGTEYLYSDRTSLYLNYLLDSESAADTGVRSKKGSLVSGVRTRYSDAFSVYLEEKYTHGDVPTGLTHAAGVDLAPADHWNVGASVDRCCRFRCSRLFNLSNT
ncbi:MAG: porin family protein [Desulfobacterales bacterium]|nr:porin family protein [Desulfobacterales bacterium]